MKVFARTKTIHDEHCGPIPYNVNIATAIEGFHQMGVEILLYNKVDEIYDLYKKGDIVLDGVRQVEYCLSKFGITPCTLDYPDALKKYLGRKIWNDTIRNLNIEPSDKGYFVKSVKDKVFSGRVVYSQTDLIGCGSFLENIEVLCSETVDFIFECRGFVYYDELIDLRPYKGSWKHMNLINTTVIEEAMKDFKTWKNRPMACALDFGVTKDNKTLLVEGNHAYALGCYGLSSNLYAKMISASVSQISSVNDECHFA